MRAFLKRIKPIRLLHGPFHPLFKFVAIARRLELSPGLDKVPNRLATFPIAGVPAKRLHALSLGLDEGEFFGAAFGFLLAAFLLFLSFLLFTLLSHTAVLHPRRKLQDAFDEAL